MKLKDLNADQRLQLKQDLLAKRMEAKGESPSYGELDGVDTIPHPPFVRVPVFML